MKHGGMDLRGSLMISPTRETIICMTWKTVFSSSDPVADAGYATHRHVAWSYAYESTCIGLQRRIHWVWISSVACTNSECSHRAEHYTTVY